MFVAVIVTAYFIVFALLLTAIAISLVADQRRNRQGQRSLDELRRQLEAQSFGWGHREKAGPDQEVRP